MKSTISTLLVVASAFSTVLAVPAQLERRIPDLNSLFSRAAPAAACNVASAKLPDAPTPLPPPSSGLVLTLVAIGRGTQNYTCATNTADSVPAAAGALATLFNGSCVAGAYPDLLKTMVGISYKLPLPTTANGNVAAATFLSAHHYFSDLTTPVFDFTTVVAPNAGLVATKKLNATNAPDPQQDVAWLKLAAKSETGDCNVQEVYRVNTNGGVPPATCAGMDSNFVVQYAAEYWFYSKA